MVDVSLQVDRMRAHFEKAWEAVSPKLSKQIRGTIHFTYLVNENVNLELGPNDSIYRIIRRYIYSQYADKGIFPQLLKSANLQHLAPPTCRTIEEALAVSDVDIWFSKDRHGTAGKNMECINHEDLADYTLPKNYVLQAQIKDICLIDAKKFTSRIYVLVWNEKVYLYNNGFHVVHGRPYDPSSTDYDIQINHAGYNDDSSPVEIKPFNVFPNMAQYMPELQKLTEDLVPALGLLRLASSKSDYIFLGIDCMLKQDGTAQIIEVNSVPNFMHTREINEQINVPFVTAAIETMLGIRSKLLTQVS